MRVSEDEEARLLPMRQISAAEYIRQNKEILGDLIKNVGCKHANHERLITPQLKTEKQPILRALFRGLKNLIKEDTNFKGYLDSIRNQPFYASLLALYKQVSLPSTHFKESPSILDILRGSYGNANKETLEMFFMDAGCRALFCRYCDMIDSYKPCENRGGNARAKSGFYSKMGIMTDKMKVQYFRELVLKYKMVCDLFEAVINEIKSLI